MSSLNFRPKLAVILGSTSSGKTNLAVEICRKYNGELISADSRQVYKGMNIGTGKDLNEYEASGDLPVVPYHLIDVVNPDEQYDLSRYQREAYTAIDDVLKRGKLPVLCGGSGLYLQAVVDGYILPEVRPDFKDREKLEKATLSEVQELLKQKNPEFFAKLNNSDVNNKRRLIRYLEVFGEVKVEQIKPEPHYNCLILGLDLPREELNERIHARLMKRLNEQNMVAEVEGLNSQGISWQRLEKFGLEYRWISCFLQGKAEYSLVVKKLYIDICRFAKRQVTWFKRWEKQGTKINWVHNHQEACVLVEEFIKK